MKNIAKSKAGLALVATAAIGLCIPAYAAPPAKYRHGGQQVQHSHRAPVHRAPQRHQRHDRDSGAGLGVLLGIAALGALIIASQADDEPVPVPAYGGPQYGPRYAPQPAPPAVYGPTAPPPPVVEQRLPAGYWYYCAEANAYYPQIQHCEGGWQQVAPNR